MPVIAKPTSDESRLNLITTSISTAKSDATSGKSYLTSETLEKANSVVTELGTKMKEETGKLANRSKEVREKNEALHILETYIRDMWDVVKRRVYRKNQPAEVFNYYQLPLDGTV